MHEKLWVLKNRARKQAENFVSLWQLPLADARGSFWFWLRQIRNYKLVAFLFADSSAHSPYCACVTFRVTKVLSSAAIRKVLAL